MLLAINTATQHNALALIDGQAVIAEETWPAAQNQAEILQPKIKELLQKNNFSWENSTHFIVVKGPGAFTSLRVGVVAANTLAFALSKPILGLSTFELYRLRFASLQPKHPDAWLFLTAGKDKAYFTNLQKAEEKIYTLAEIAAFMKQHNVQQIFGDITPAQEDCLHAVSKDKLVIIPETKLCSFGQALLKLDWAQLKWEKQIEPYYVQPANITMPCST